jgi:hypothetical protein
MQAPHDKKCREVACTPARDTLAIKENLFLTNRNPYPHHHGKKQDSPQANQSARQGSKSDPWDHPGACRLEWLGGEAGCIEGDVRAPDSHYSYGQFAVSAQIDRRRATILFRRHKVDGGVRSLWGGSRPCPTGRDGNQEVMAMLCTKLRCGSFPRPQSLRGPS